MNTIYGDGAGKEFFFSAFKFYVSHIKLIKNDNSTVELSEVEFFDYSETISKSFSVNAPAGDYKGIEFFVGLDSAQDKTKPEDYPASEPLGPKTGMYWPWLNHRFVNLEGTADTLGQNFAGGNIGLNYHVGTDACYRQVSLLGKPFSIIDGASKTIYLNVDILKVFYGQTDSLDMFLNPGTQSENNDIGVAIKFADQFSKAFSYSD
ncbi:MAG: hypothetical protein IPP77_08745 [Bacteroidetes bacterium]|nr:hypothetical protein [Bacteroidota bacterium]